MVSLAALAMAAAFGGPVAQPPRAEEAREEIRQGSGSQFSPVVAEALLRVFERDPAEFGAQPRHATV